MKASILLVGLTGTLWACPLCGGSNPWQSAEGPAGMQLGRLRRVYKSRYDQPVKIEVRDTDEEKAAARNGEAVPITRSTPPPKPKAKPSKPK